MKLNCKTNMTTADDFQNLANYTRGDPGSIFTFECAEANCSDKGELIGAGLYAYKSPICKAAVQQSLMDDSETSYVSVVIG